MARPKKRVPTLTRHNASGRAKCRWRGGDHWFGKWGTPEAEAAFGRFVAAVMQGEEPDGPAARRSAAAAGPLTVTGLVALYRDHLLRTHVGPDGTPTQHVDNTRLGVRLWRRTYGHLPVAEFGPLRLAELRDTMIDAGLARRTIQQRIGFVVGCVRWGVSRELVEPAVLQKLEALEPLRKGRSAAKEPEPVGPVGDADLEAALPFMPPPVAAMARVQRWTAARPGEVCGMTPGEIDRTGEVWAFRPVRHKNAHRGKARTIHLGPRCRTLLAPLLAAHEAAGRKPTDPLFQPKDATAAMLAERRTRRVTPESCGNVPGSNRKAEPKRAPGAAYSTDSYRQAITRACEKAGVPPFGPNRLRHAAATEVRERFGLDTARAALGHAGGSVTEVYAAASADVAARVAAKVG